SSGSRFGPKITSAMMRTTANSNGPIFGTTGMLLRPGPRVGRSALVGARGLEVLVETGRGRLRLTLVLAPRLLAPVRALDREVHAHERDLSDRHPVVDRDREVGDVR